MNRFYEILATRCGNEVRNATSVLEGLRTSQQLVAVSSGARQIESDAMRLKSALLEVGAAPKVTRSPVRISAVNGAVRYVADGDVDALVGLRYDGWFYGNLF